MIDTGDFNNRVRCLLAFRSIVSKRSFVGSTQFQLMFLGKSRYTLLLLQFPCYNLMQIQEPGESKQSKSQIFRDSTPKNDFRSAEISHLTSHVVVVIIIVGFNINVGHNLNLCRGLISPVQDEMDLFHVSRRHSQGITI